MRGYNSTIRLKEKVCLNCGRPCIWFSHKRCKECATREGVHKSEEKEAKMEFSTLIDELDDVFSKYIRLKSADEKGECKCFTCNKTGRWQEMQCGHFISRKHMYLRWDSRNCVVQCQHCNEYLSGNMVVYRQRLEQLSPGLPDILEEESRIVHKWLKHELKAMIKEYRNKLKLLQK